MGQITSIIKRAVVIIKCSLFAPSGITAAMFKEEEDVPAMSIAALEKKYHCVVEVGDKNVGSVATPRHHKQALMFYLFFTCLQLQYLRHLMVFNLLSVFVNITNCHFCNPDLLRKLALCLYCSEH